MQMAITGTVPGEAQGMDEVEVLRALLSSTHPLIDRQELGEVTQMARIVALDGAIGSAGAGDGGGLRRLTSALRVPVASLDAPRGSR
jgi:hypothetical protein